MAPTRPPLGDRVFRTFNRIRARGPAEVLRLAIERMRGWVHSEEVLLLMVRDASPLPRTAGSLSVRPASEIDAERYAADIGTDSTASFRHRLGPQTLCYLVDDGRRLLHASWVTTDRAWTREINGHISPPEGDAYVYESYTHPDARGRGVYPFALAGIVTDMAEKGVQHVWVGADRGNVASRRAIEKAGFSEGFSLPYRRTFGRVEVGSAYGPQADMAPLLLRYRR